MAGAIAEGRRPVCSEERINEVARVIGASGSFKTSALLGQGLREVFDHAIDIVISPNSKAAKKRLKAAASASSSSRYHAKSNACYCSSMYGDRCLLALSVSPGATRYRHNSHRRPRMLQ